MTRPVVADASAILDYMLQRPGCPPVGELTAKAWVHVPALTDVEVLSGLRRALLRDLVSEPEAREVLAHYGWLRLRRHRHAPLLERALQLRSNFTAGDATYVALAERLSARLLTKDARLARAVVTHTRVELAAL